MTDEPSEKEIVLAPDAIPVRGTLAPALDAPDLVELTIAFPRSSLQRHFRLAREEMPPYELVGFHGFTGLNYVSTPGSDVDVQLICEASARNEERPKPLGHGQGSPSPEPSKRPPPTPFRIRCETTVSDKTDSFVLEGPTERTVILGGPSAALHLYDDPYEGRSLTVRFPNELQQLYQLDRSMPVVDVTRGPGGLTGRTILGSTSADVVRFACGATD